MKNVFFRLFFCINLLFCFCFRITAQTSFQKIYGGNYNSTGDAIRQTTDGGFVITGYTAVPGGGSAPDGYLVKTDANGTMLWNKTFGGVDRDYPKAVQQSPDGGYIMAGFIQNNNTLKVQVYVVKMDSSGNLTWSRHLGSSVATSNSANDVEATSDGGFVVSGSSRKMSNDYDGFLFKTDGSGTVIWGKHFGGISHDLIHSMSATSDGGFILGGYSGSFGLTNYDMYLIKTDLSGNVLWSKTYGDGDSNIGIAVKQTSDSGYILIGYTQSSSSGSRDIMVIKTDSLGNHLWNKVYGGPGFEMPYAVCEIPGQGYVITGDTDSGGAGLSDIYIIRTDYNGDTTWTKTVGLSGYDDASDIISDGNGSFILTGGSSSGKATIIKSDASGFTGCNEGASVTSVASIQISEASQVTSVSNAYFGVIGYITTIGTMGTDSTICTSVGLESIENLEQPFKLYPNPASGYLVIENVQQTYLTCEIFDVCWNKLYEENFINDNKTTIATNDLVPGIYFVKLITDKAQWISKLIIQ